MCNLELQGFQSFLVGRIMVYIFNKWISTSAFKALGNLKYFCMPLPPGVYIECVYIYKSLQQARHRDMTGQRQCTWSVCFPQRKLVLSIWPFLTTSCEMLVSFVETSSRPGAVSWARARPSSWSGHERTVLLHGAQRTEACPGVEGAQAANLSLVFLLLF